MSWLDFCYECAIWPFQRNQRHVLAWVLAIILSLHLVYTCLREGVGGHNTCDFAGQWMHGRAFYREECQNLYLVEAGKRWLAEGYKDKELETQVNDVLKKGYRHELYNEGVAGALYPPTASVLFSLINSYTPPTAHAIAVIAYILMCYGCGWMISRLTDNRLQWGEAALLILFFPNNFMGLMLGQNQVLSLTILVSGWFCYQRGWRLVGGMIWGFFCYKPVFTVALMLVPLALRQPKLLLGMILGGILAVAGTLPFTGGIEPWLRWLKVGKHAEEVYQTDRNWIWMSRDLVGLPRRKMWDPESFAEVMRYNIGSFQPGFRINATTTKGEEFFYPSAWLFYGVDFDHTKHQGVYLNTPPDNQDVSPWHLTLIGYFLLGTVAGVTVLLGWRAHTPHDLSDAPTAHMFVLTGSLLCVFHFMHYDLLSFALPVLLAVGEVPRWNWQRRFWFILWYLAWLGRTCAFFFGDTILAVPWETFMLLIFWAGMGIWAWRDRTIDTNETSIFYDETLGSNPPLLTQ